MTAWGGLGHFIVDGLGQRDDPQIVAGAIVAVMALAEERLGQHGFTKK